MSFDFISYKVINSVAHLTLNRPDVLNSFNREMAKEVQAVLASAQDDDSIRCVLFTGAGRAFCAGQDLAEVSDPNNSEIIEEIVKESYSPIIKGIRHLEKPVVCAVNGVAAGAGANIALACDLVIASENASFIQSFCHVGLIPDSGGTFFLPRLVGLPRATAMAMLGEKISAKLALEYGMIYKVVEHDKLKSESLNLSERLASMPTTGLGLIKRGFNRSFSNDLDSQLEFEEELQGIAGKTHDYREGVRAFIEKRKPKFTGK
ncbi:2-(1,2-epoxy-1,2-dihydrophenyl)acetyl-CoA isomerase [candidate division KSB1 bacterium]|nr:2-(1,2-epoxy-1,2-dihydrophenyl)acetyl-CoA isomerase [candidate division KSB1 bacterium]